MPYGTDISESPEELPKGESYVFHVAPAEHLEPILYEGLAPDRGSAKDWSALNAYLMKVARDAGCSPPIQSRESCVFAYPTRERGVEPTANLSMYATIAIDTRRVRHSVYTASYGAATGVMAELRQGNGAVEPTNEAYETAVSYWESMEPYGGGFGKGEVLIDGRVHPNAMTHVFGDTSYVHDP